MPKTNILDTTKNVLDLLKKKELTVNQVSSKLKIQWKTAIRSLEFLKDIGLIEERKGKTTYKTERIFRIKK